MSTLPASKRNYRHGGQHQKITEMKYMQKRASTFLKFILKIKNELSKFSKPSNTMSLNIFLKATVQPSLPIWNWPGGVDILPDASHE